MTRARAVAVSAAALALSLAASACSFAREAPADLARRHVAAPDAFADAGADATPVRSGWVAEFGDDALVALVDEALAHNPDLFAAAARVEEARALLRQSGARLRPAVGASGAAARRDTGVAEPFTATSVALEASWELDLWGRLRADRAAAARDAEARLEDYAQARHVVAAAVAEAWFALAAAAEAVAIQEQRLAAERFTAETTGQRFAVGATTQLEDGLSAANVALAEAALLANRSARLDAARALEVLLGRYPAAEIAAPTALPRIDGAVAAGVPSELLERRPDVRAAAARVAGAFHGVQSARAARLPSLVLSGDVGRVFDPDATFWSIAAGVFAPLYQGGALRAAVDAADARQREALGAYAGLALAAFREVEDALARERFLAAREVELATASERLREVGRIAENRYESGVLSIIDLTQVRRQDFETRSLLLAVRHERLRERVRLHLALGGPLHGDAADALPTTDHMAPSRPPQRPEPPNDDGP